MAAAVIALPGADTTTGLFQSTTLGVAVYGFAAIALNIMGVRDLALAGVRRFLHRAQPVSSPANVE
jgi:hypothetical protein